MKKHLTKFLYHFAALMVAIFILGGGPVKFGQENTFFHGFLIKKPIIRVGLGVNLGDVEVTSSSGMKIYEVKSNYKLIADDVKKVLLRGHKEKLDEKFVIQVAQREDREDADVLAQDLRNRFGDNQKVTVVRDHEAGIAGVWQIRIGDFISREETLKFITILNQAGFRDTWIISEDITKDSTPLWIMVNNEMKTLDEDTVLYFIPSNPQSVLSFKGREYRGIFILKSSPKGVVMVNLLHLEDYLKSVVPSELSPYMFREIEAHKAQAVAARTYAIKNMGLEDDLGFDLFDTPKHQFYQGINAEHPLSTRAVEETRGQVILYKGNLIDALYTSTCGGRTENVENVFDGPALPYLRSMECVYENQPEWTLTTSTEHLPVYVNGQNIARSIAVLTSLDILKDKQDPVFYVGSAQWGEIFEWLQKAASFLNINEPVVVPAGKPVTYLTFAETLIQTFGLGGRAAHLVQDSESDFILKGMENIELGKRKQLALLIKENIYPPASVIHDAQKPLLRGEVVRFIVKSIQSIDQLFHVGQFMGMEDEKLVLDNSDDELSLPLATNAYLMQSQDGSNMFIQKAFLIGGEEVSWIEKEGLIRMLDIRHSSPTNVLDRGSSYHSWKVRRTAEQLEHRINAYFPIGKIVDIIPQKRGESRRIVDLLVKGESASAVVRGLRIRNVLGLRDTLFVIERVKDEKGHNTAYIFNGKGWGHGVGLCQVGAFGMAKSGAGYKDILKKYYTGVKIDTIY